MRKVFTLVELIVVIAIIAILSAVIAPSAYRAIEKSKIARLEADIKSVGTAIYAYYADTGLLPPSNPDNIVDPEPTLERQNFVTGENQPAGWDGPYLEKWPKSPLNISGYPYYRYMYPCPCVFYMPRLPGSACVYLRLGFIPEKLARKIRMDMDGYDFESCTYYGQTGKVRYTCSSQFIYFILIDPAQSTTGCLNFD